LYRGKSQVIFQQQVDLSTDSCKWTKTWNWVYFSLAKNCLLPLS